MHSLFFQYLKVACIILKNAHQNFIFGIWYSIKQNNLELFHDVWKLEKSKDKSIKQSLLSSERLVIHAIQSFNISIFCVLI